MLTSEAAGLIINAAKGLLKIQRRVDQVLAEKEATEAPLAIPLPDIRRTPTLPQMRSALTKLLEDTNDDDPDPLDPDRDDIRDAVENDASRLFELMGRHLPEQALGPVISLNSEFVAALHPDWASDPDLRVAAFFVGAGRDFREKSYTWRLALTVADVVAEFGAENAALFVRDESAQGIVAAVLARFGEADLQRLDSTGDLLRVALAATLEGVLDARAFVRTGEAWVASLLDAIVAARAAMPEGQQGDFVLGLLRGEGYPRLVGSLLEAAATRLDEDEARDFKDVTADFLREVGDVVSSRPSFRGFFEDHWGDLLRAGLGALERNGPALMRGESPLLTAVLTAVARDLSTRPNSKLLSGDLLYGIANAAIGAVAANPDLVDDVVDQAWLGALIGSVTSTVANEGLRESFSKKGLEALWKDTLTAFARHPELIVERSELGRELLRGVLTALAETEALAAEELATAAVGGALSALGEHPELIEFQYTNLVASLSGKVGALVKARGLTRTQGGELLRVVTTTVSENPALLIDGEKRLVGWATDAVIAAAAEDGGGLLSGGMLTRVIEETITALGTSGRAALKNHSVADFPSELQALVTAGLVRAEKEMGNQIGLSAVPSVIGALVIAWSRGEIATSDAENDNFRRLFSELIARVAA
jgi:hypothetical protein